MQRETENLSAASPDLIDEPSEASPRTDVESGTDQSLADSSALDNSDDQADMPMDDLPAAQKAQLTDDDYGWLMDTARILWAATELDKHDILEYQRLYQTPLWGLAQTFWTHAARFARVSSIKRSPSRSLRMLPGVPRRTSRHDAAQIDCGSYRCLDCMA